MSIKSKRVNCHDAHHHCAHCHDEEHEKQKTKFKKHKEHKCDDRSCNIKNPHGHIKQNHEHDSCISCMRDHLKKIFPFETKIKHLKTNQPVKEFLLMLSNLTPAILVSKTVGNYGVSNYISSPLSLASMHFLNRGFDRSKLPKFLLTGLSSLELMLIKQLTSLSDLLTRPIMACLVFFIEKNSKHIHNHKSSKHTHKNSLPLVSKNDLLKLLKLQIQINTVPYISKFLTSKLPDKILIGENVISRFLNSAVITSFQILSLSFGFLGLGKLIDPILNSNKTIGKDSVLTSRAEAGACACCGAPVCVVEAASEATSSLIAA